MLARMQRKRSWAGTGAKEEVRRKSRARAPDWQNYEGHTDTDGVSNGNPGPSPNTVKREEKSSTSGPKRPRVINHEMECCFESENDLRKKLIDCIKNPGHENFVPIVDFGLQHLPEDWRDDLVLNFIKARGDLTVRLRMDYTSTARPGGYPCHELRGIKANRCGSGMVWRVSRRFSKKNGQLCPCEECQKNPKEAKQQWGQFGILTASHVIYDDEECRRTTCDLFYDSREVRNKCPTLKGVRVYRNKVKYDHCKITCITHDEEVSNKLAAMVDRYEALHTKLERGYDKPGLGMVPVETCVIISHPHGMTKQVTIGDRFFREPAPPHRWSYTTQTCPGSSGAPVCLLRNKGWRRPFIISSAHSACNENGNECGAGWAYLT